MSFWFAQFFRRTVIWEYKSKKNAYQNMTFIAFLNKFHSSLKMYNLHVLFI